MDSTIISSLISAAVTLAICLITTNAQAKKTEALMAYKIEELTKKVERHNNVIERVTILEHEDAHIKQDINELFDRARRLEGGV